MTNVARGFCVRPHMVMHNISAWHDEAARIGCPALVEASPPLTPGDLCTHDATPRPSPESFSTAHHATDVQHAGREPLDDGGSQPTREFSIRITEVL